MTAREAGQWAGVVVAVASGLGGLAGSCATVDALDARVAGLVRGAETQQVQIEALRFGQVALSRLQGGTTDGTAREARSDHSSPR